MTEDSIATESAPSGKDCADETTSVPSGISIEDLPDELLLAITKCLDLPSQCQLTLVNRHFGEIARDAIYYRIQLRGPQDGRVGHISNLHRTLNAQPQIAERVRHLWIQPVCRDTFFDSSEYFRLPASARSILPKWLLKAAVSEPALTGALLSLLPGLNFLHISVLEDQLWDGDQMIRYYHPAPDPLYVLFGIPGGEMEDHLLQIPGLQHLEALNFGGAQQLHWAWMCLPLRSLFLERDVQIRMPTWKQSPTRHGISLDMCPTLTSLSLVCSVSILAFDESYYSFIPETLARCGNVDDLFFIMQGDNPRIWMNHNRQGSVDVLVGLITRASSKLRELYIKLEDDDQSFWNFVQPVTRLDQFSSLHSLSIPQAALLGATYGSSSVASTGQPIIKLLPASLVHLSILQIRLSIMRWLEDVVRSRNDLPSLWKIELECANVGKDTYERFIYTEHMYPVWNQLVEAGYYVHYGHNFCWESDWNDEDYDPLVLDILEDWVLW